MKEILLTDTSGKGKVIKLQKSKKKKNDATLLKIFSNWFAEKREIFSLIFKDLESRHRKMNFVKILLIMLKHYNVIDIQKAKQFDFFRSLVRRLKIISRLRFHRHT